MNRRISTAGVMLLAFSSLSVQAAEFADLVKLGQTLGDAGDCKGSELVFAEALTVTPPGTRPIDLVPVWNGLGLARDEQGRFADSERFFRKALAAIESAEGSENPVYAAVLANLGGSLLGQGQLQSAEYALREAIRIHTHTGPRTSNLLFLARAGLVELLIARKDWKNGEPVARQTVQELSRPEDIRSGRHGMAINNLAVMRSEQGDQMEAIPLLQQAVAEIENNLGPDHPLLVQCLANLASAYTAAGQKRDVDALFRRALAISESHAGAQNPTYATVLMNYSAFLRKAGRKKESQAVRARSIEASAENARRNGIGARLDVSSFRDPTH